MRLVMRLVMDRGQRPRSWVILLSLADRASMDWLLPIR
jgi:hypothetical protein